MCSSAFLRLPFLLCPPIQHPLTHLKPAKQGILSKHSLSWKRYISIAKDIIRGLGYLHDRNIIHRDLKPLNILMDKDGVTKISDFGLAHVKNKPTGHPGVYGVTGTPTYMAPEVLRDDKYCQKADIFSLGVVLCEMISRKYPYAGMDEASTFTFEEAIIEGIRPPVDIPGANVPEDLQALIKSCWAEDPKERPNISEVKVELYLIEEREAAREQARKKEREAQGNTVRSPKYRAARAPTPLLGVTLPSDLRAFKLDSFMRKKKQEKKEKQEKEDAKKGKGAGRYAKKKNGASQAASKKRNQAAWARKALEGIGLRVTRQGKQQDGDGGDKEADEEENAEEEDSDDEEPLARRARRKKAAAKSSEEEEEEEDEVSESESSLEEVSEFEELDHESEPEESDHSSDSDYEEAVPRRRSRTPKNEDDSEEDSDVPLAKKAGRRAVISPRPRRAAAKRKKLRTPVRRSKSKTPPTPARDSASDSDERPLAPKRITLLRTPEGRVKVERTKMTLLRSPRGLLSKKATSSDDESDHVPLAKRATRAALQPASSAEPGGTSSESDELPLARRHLADRLQRRGQKRARRSKSKSTSKSASRETSGGSDDSEDIPLARSAVGKENNKNGKPPKKKGTPLAKKKAALLPLPGRSRLRKAGAVAPLSSLARLGSADDGDLYSTSAMDTSAISNSDSDEPFARTRTRKRQRQRP